MNGVFASWPEELAKSARQRPDKRAVAELTSDGKAVRRELSFAELWRSSLGVAQWLRDQGVKSKSRFAILGDDSLEHVVLWAAAALNGSVAVTIDALAPLTSISEVIEDAEPSVVLILQGEGEDALVTAGQAAQIREACKQPIKVFVLRAGELLDAASKMETLLAPEKRRDRDLEAPWAILYTSGTSTGRKKGVVRSQRGHILGYFAHLTHMHFRPAQETFLALYPLHGISSFFFVTMLLYLGDSVLLLSRKHSASGEAIFNAADTFPVSFTTGGPAHLVSIIDHAETHAGGKQLLGLRMIMASGAMTSTATQERIRAFYAKASFYEVYGSTEAGIISILDPSDFQDNKGSVGIEPSGVSEVRFVDPGSGAPVAGTVAEPGEIAVRTPMMCRGYWRRSPERIDGWFCTGDMGYRSESGFLYLLGRADDRITLPTGASFYPSEVERAMLRHTRVSQVVVFWDDGAQSLAALVLARNVTLVSSDGPAADASGVVEEAVSGSLLERDILAHCEAHLAPHLVPDVVLPLSESSWTKLPKTATRKIMRSRLRLHAL